MRIKLLLQVLFLMLLSEITLAQGVAVNNSGNAADTSAQLDISSVNKGVLVPRVALQDSNDAVTIALPASSLLVYNTNQGNGLVEGFYYNSGTSFLPHWVELLPTPANNVLDMSNMKIVNLATCTNGLDAANKNYVDNAVLAGGGGSGGSMPTMLSLESSSTMNFGSAMRYCHNLVESVGGVPYSDWHLPSFEELTHVASGGGNYVPDSTSTRVLWTTNYDNSMSVYSNGGYIYGMRLSDGYYYTYSATSSQYVRCVR